MLLSEVVTSGPNEYRLIWHTADPAGGAACGRVFPVADKVPESVRKRVKLRGTPWDKKPTCPECQRMAGLDVRGGEGA